MSIEKDKPNEDFKRSKKAEQELARERRRQSALERLRSNRPVCVVCGEGDPIVQELHHFAGKNFDPLTGPICRNCHRKLSDRQKDEPGKIYEQPHPLEIIAHFLMGLAAFFALLIEKLEEFAAILIEWADEHLGNLEVAS